MDRNLFTPASPGKLLGISAPGKDYAFLPDPLPETWQPPSGMVPLLVRAREALARLDAAGRFLPTSRLLLRPLQQREALKSSSLEGTYASPEDLLAYGLSPKEPSSARDPVNDWREVFNYDKALREGQQILEQDHPLSNRFIRGLHETLLTGVRGSSKAPGQFRRTQVHIGSDRRFVPPPAAAIPDLMGDLEKFIHADLEMDGLVRAFFAHYQFETIHPFLDGNGRVGRLLLSLLVYRWCGLHGPWLYLSAFFDRYKDEYIRGLFRVSTEGAWHEWIDFCLRATVVQAEDSMNRVDKLIALQKKYDELIAARNWPGRMHQVVAYLLGSPMIDIPTLAKEFSVTYPTAKTDVTRLIEIGVLALTGRYGRARFYVAREIYHIAYSEPEIHEEIISEEPEQQKMLL